MSLIDRIRRTFTRTPEYDFTEGKVYYHSYVERSFEVIEVDRDANNMVIVYDYAPDTPFDQVLDLYERKANSGVIYPLDEHNPNTYHEN